MDSAPHYPGAPAKIQGQGFQGVVVGLTHFQTLSDLTGRRKGQGLKWLPDSQKLK